MAVRSDPNEDDEKAVASTERSAAVPVLEDESCMMYWLVPVWTAEAMMPVPAELMLATMSAREPFPVEMLVAVTVPVDRSELLTVGSALRAFSVAEMVPPEPELRLTVASGGHVGEGVGRPVHRDDAVDAGGCAGHGAQPQRGQGGSAGHLQALRTALVGRRKDQIAVVVVAGLQDARRAGRADGRLHRGQKTRARVAHPSGCRRCSVCTRCR